MVQAPPPPTIPTPPFEKTSKSTAVLNITKKRKHTKYTRNYNTRLGKHQLNLYFPFHSLISYTYTYMHLYLYLFIHFETLSDVPDCLGMNPCQSIKNRVAQSLLQ